VLRIALTFFALSLLSLPYLRLVGALLLMWIGIKLILPEEEHHGDHVQADTRLFGAVKTVIVADFVMSLDNVLGVAGAAKGNVALLIFGLLISIPLIAWSSQLVLKLMDRFAMTIYAGGALLGYVAGEMLVSEAFPATGSGIGLPGLEAASHYLHWLIPVLCALLVLVLGKLLAMRKVVRREVIDLVDEEVSAVPDRK
jgi:YjbE family integral membrane protein